MKTAFRFLLTLLLGFAPFAARPALPISGTFINLAYQDVRNKYTNPQYFDNTDPTLWQLKVEELQKMGMKYIVLMEIANEGKAFYPSTFMPHAYHDGRLSPVEAIVNEADKLGMKVFMSTGWAESQDDNIRDPKIVNKQLHIMEEAAAIFGKHASFYGWYLPVEDCLCPILSEHAVKAVNSLAEHARKLTPGKKILISPYGIVSSDFSNPDYEKNLSKLKVDIIAYQDEIGCVREDFPLVRLRENWAHLREIHNRNHIAMWANCELFTWQNAPNDRNSALIPAAFPRVLSQLCIATQAGVENVISFTVCGLWEPKDSQFQLGQPLWSKLTAADYADWYSGSGRWGLLEASMCGILRNSAVQATIKGNDKLKALIDENTAIETTNDSRWVSFSKGHHEITIDLGSTCSIEKVMVRMLNFHKGGIDFPEKFYLYTSSDGTNYQLAQIKDTPVNPNNSLDAWIDAAMLDAHGNARYLRLAFNAPSTVMIDEIFVNPLLVR
jgi:hypothetical protein